MANDQSKLGIKTDRHTFLHTIQRTASCGSLSGTPSGEEFVQSGCFLGVCRFLGRCGGSPRRRPDRHPPNPATVPTSLPPLAGAKLRSSAPLSTHGAVALRAAFDL